MDLIDTWRFKPYYNWITFNTKWRLVEVTTCEGFKPYYNWITFNTSGIITLNG